MPQVDPWEKAADCERALRITVDPIRRETLSNIREFWIALAQESRFLSEEVLAANSLRLYIWIAARCARRRNHLELTAAWRRNLHFTINASGRANDALRLGEFVAQGR